MSLVRADPRADETLRRLMELDRLCFREALRYDEADHRARLAKPGAEVLAALTPRGAWAGAASYVVEPARIFLDVLAVRPERRGERIGPLLVGAVLERAREMGAARVDVHAERRDQRGLDLVRFYADLGFAVHEDHGDWLALTRAP